MSPRMFPQPPKKKCGILGATGTVGQRFISLIGDSHPYFTIHALGASPRSAGKLYPDAVNWKLADDIPEGVQQTIVQLCEPKGPFLECDVVFSGLDADVAGDIGLNLGKCLVIVELAFLKANIPIFSNAKNYRRHAHIPLVVPVVNTSHIIPLLESQRQLYGLEKRGFMVTNANCSTTGLVVPLKALQDKFGPFAKVSAVTMQAISGAGYPGVASLDILDNVVPYIGGEEEKMEWETSKILGIADPSTETGFNMLKIPVSVHCNRVPVLDGHLISLSLSFQTKPTPSVEEVIDALSSYVSEVQSLPCPSAPKQAIVVLKQQDRPQPRLDRMREGGYAVSVGRVRKDDSDVFDIKMTVLVHNTVLGAAGSSLLIGEYCVAKGLL